MEVPAVYSEQPRRCPRQERAYRFESKTRQFPFVVADDSQNEGRSFLVFHDVEHFLTLKSYFPHTHEIIRCPIISTDGEDQTIEANNVYDDCQSVGRLLFDFDLTQPLECAKLGFNVTDPKYFVPEDFKFMIEQMIKDTFIEFYVDVDVSRLVFIWQLSPSDEKFSYHLIVKNAYFADFWSKQMKAFYNLMERRARELGREEYFKAIDIGMTRRNATFRFIGSSKPGRQPLTIDRAMGADGTDYLDGPQGSQTTIYDCLVGIYHYEHLVKEQRIYMDQLNYYKLEEQFAKIKTTPNPSSQDRNFQRSMKNLFPSLSEEEAIVDLSNEDVSRAVDVFRSWNQDVFAVRNQRGSIINLNRLKRGECPISGIYHDNENAYIKMRSDGQMVFICYRGCKDKFGSYCRAIGCYKTIDVDSKTGQEKSIPSGRPKGIVPLNTTVLKMATLATTTKVADINPLTKKTIKQKKESKPKRTTKSTGSCAKSVVMQNISVVISPAILSCLSSQRPNRSH